jgi:hypothetical protein
MPIDINKLISIIKIRLISESANLFGGIENIRSANLGGDINISVIS